MRACSAALALLVTASVALQATDVASAADPVLIPQTANEWKALRQRRDQALLEPLAKLREHFGVTVTPRMIAGVACYEIMPKSIAAGNGERLVVNSHGGSHVFKAGEAGTLEGIYLAGLASIRVIEIDHRLPPDHPFPAGMDDVTKVWKEIVKHTHPSRIAVYGVSSGGSMALSLAQRAKAEGLPLPAAMIAATPWSDLSKTGDSYFTHANLDRIVGASEGLLESAARLYANGIDLKDPRLSPVYGDFDGFPPTFLVSGTRDLFLSNTVRVDRKLRHAGVETHLEIYDGHSHGEFLMADTPDTRELFASIARFLDAHLSH
jgi:acetyl esterase/lipase